jgi:hypothetical protein
LTQRSHRCNVPGGKPTCRRSLTPGILRERRAVKHPSSNGLPFLRAPMPGAAPPSTRTAKAEIRGDPRSRLAARFAARRILWA